MIHQIELALNRYLDAREQNELTKAIRYALLAGGKRIRPLLILSLLKSKGYHPMKAIDLAISVEMLHTYSLIHDDLPAMDDDTLRRGKPTLHIAFNEGLAILAGDALLTDSFEQISKQEEIDPSDRVKMIRVLSMKTGSLGMVLGQVDDLASEGKVVTIEALTKMYERKTANLLQASLLIGAIYCKETDLELYDSLGYDLGLLFQIQDDVLEATTSVEKLGKSKSDEDRLKPTFVTLLGLEKAKNEIERYEQRVKDTIKRLHLQDTPFESFVSEVFQRKY